MRQMATNSRNLKRKRGDNFLFSIFLSANMALFANCNDLAIHPDQRMTKLASVNFVASSRVSEELALSGHLALSAPSQIMGQFQFLKVCSFKARLPTFTHLMWNRHYRIQIYANT